MSTDPQIERATSAPLEDARRHWRLMSAYERFEQLVVLALSLIIAVVIVIALIELYRQVVPLIVGGALDPLDHRVFQQLFGAMFTVLIAMEFKHSIIRAALRRDSIIQVRTVILIALLAMSRKFVVVDITTTPPGVLAALAAVTLALGAVYGMLRWSDSIK